MAPKRRISPGEAAQIRCNSSRIRVHAMTLPHRCAGVDRVTPYQPLREAAMTHPHTSQKPGTAHVTVKHLPSPSRSRGFPPIEERILVPPMPLSASSRADCPRSTHPQRRADHKPQWPRPAARFPSRRRHRGINLPSFSTGLMVEIHNRRLAQVTGCMFHQQLWVPHVSILRHGRPQT